MKRKIAASIALMACIMAVTPVAANAAVKNSRCYTSGNGKVVVITGGKLPPCNGNNVDIESDSENVDTESNEYAQRVVELVNIEREKAGLSELKWQQRQMCGQPKSGRVFPTQDRTAEALQQRLRTTVSATVEVVRTLHGDRKHRKKS